MSTETPQPPTSPEPVDPDNFYAEDVPEGVTTEAALAPAPAEKGKDGIAKPGTVKPGTVKPDNFYAE